MHHVVRGASRRTPLQPSPCGVDVIVCCKGQHDCAGMQAVLSLPSLQSALDEAAVRLRGKKCPAKGPKGSTSVC